MSTNLPESTSAAALEPVNPPSLGTPRGFTHGWLAPASARILFVSGQTATDDQGRIVDGGLVPQFKTCLARVLAVVEAAGGTAAHVVRMTVFVTDMDAYLAARSELASVWKARLGRHYPAMALVEVKRLVDTGALVEIEATAAIPPASEDSAA